MFGIEIRRKVERKQADAERLATLEGRNAALWKVIRALQADVVDLQDFVDEIATFIDLPDDIQLGSSDGGHTEPDRLEQREEQPGAATDTGHG
jgi:predicted nuclease with TOPRIM domain